MSLGKNQQKAAEDLGVNRKTLQRAEKLISGFFSNC